jgi:hypothetical protein
MKGIAAFLNYITTNFAYSFGQFWDPSGNIRASIKTDLAMISGASTDWPALIAAGERLGIRIEEEEEKLGSNNNRLWNRISAAAGDRSAATVSLGPGTDSALLVCVG